MVVVEPALPADDHRTPAHAHRHRCGWSAAMAIEVDPAWRSGDYEVVLEIDVDGKRRRSCASFVVRPRPSAQAPRSCSP